MDQLGTFVSAHWALVAAFFVLLVLVVQSFLGARGINSVGPIEAVELMNRQSAVVLDVRTDDEFKAGHVVNAVHVPVGLLSGRLQELDKFKTQPVVVYCHTGHRSAQACAVLRKEGFASIYKMAGGMTAWQKANLPVVKG